MKIKVEGYFNEISSELAQMDTDREFPDFFSFRQYMKRKGLDLPSNPVSNNNETTNNKSSETWAMDKFHEYVNHSRSPWMITADNTFTGGYKVLKKFADGFEKAFKGMKVDLTEVYKDGEYVPKVRSVIYNGGE